MSSEFKTVKLGDYLYIKGRIGWKGLKKEEYLDDGKYRIINATALENDGINWNNCGFISKERYDESPEIMLKDGDILISKDGTIGKIGYVNNLNMPTTVASGIFVIRNLNKGIIDTDYLYYYFKSSFFKGFIKSRTEGSVIPHLYQRDFTELDFNIFKLDIQKKISHILKNIDEKILNNNQLNKNLEVLLHIIFSKMFGKKMGKTVEIGKIIDVRDGTHDSPKSIEKGFPLITSKHLLSFSQNISDANQISQQDYEKINERSKVNTLDILISMIGTVGIISLVTDVNVKFAIKNVGLFKTSENIEYAYYVYCYLKTPLISQHIKSCMSGSTQKYISLGELRKIPFIIPDNDSLKSFNDVVSQIFELIIKNQNENSKLAILRNILLPKLMSGEIDVSEVEI